MGTTSREEADGVERDTVFEIIRFLESGSADRKTIGNSLKISQKAVGCAVNDLLRLKIASEYMRKDSTPGRHAGAVILRREQVFATVRITPRYLRTDFFGFDLTVSASDSFGIGDPLFVDDVFTSFFRGLNERQLRLLGVCLISSGVPADGRFTGTGIPGLDGLPIAEIAAEHLPGVSVRLAAFAEYCLAAADSRGVSGIINDIDGAVEIAVLCDGALLRGARDRAGDISRMRDPAGRSLQLRLRHIRSHRDYASLIAGIAAQMIFFCDPHRICFSTDRYSSEGEILRGVAEELVLRHGMMPSELPELVLRGSLYDPTLSSLRRKVRDSYIDEALEGAL